MLQFEFMMTLAAEVGEIVTLGAGPLGERRLIGITGGSFEGPALRGVVLPAAMTGRLCAPTACWTSMPATRSGPKMAR